MGWVVWSVIGGGCQSANLCSRSWERVSKGGQPQAIGLQASKTTCNSFITSLPPSPPFLPRLAPLKADWQRGLPNPRLGASSWGFRLASWEERTKRVQGEGFPSKSRGPGPTEKKLGGLSSLPPLPPGPDSAAQLSHPPAQQWLQLHPRLCGLSFILYLWLPEKSWESRQGAFGLTCRKP